MNGFEPNPIDVLCAPGIQSHPDDWELLQRETGDFLRMHIADQQPEATGLSREEWIARTIEYECGIIREHAITVAFAHSFGTHRTLKTLADTRGIEAAFFFNPARNSIRKVPDTTPSATSVSDMDGVWLRRSYDDFMEEVMWEPCLDMNDAVFRMFTQRHGARYREKRKHIRAQFNFLSNGPTFAEQLEDYKGETPIFIFQSADDPWHPGPLPYNPQVTQVALPEKTRHYPYVSIPQYIGRDLRSRLTELGILTTRSAAPAQSNLVPAGV